MTQTSFQAPEQRTGFSNILTGAFMTAVTVLAGLLAFAPFFMPING